MKVAIELPPAEAAQLEAEAKRLGVSIEGLARAAVTDFLAAPDDERSQRIASRLATKYREALKELAK
jgi:hypothetical protein